MDFQKNKLKYPILKIQTTANYCETLTVAASNEVNNAMTT